MKGGLAAIVAAMGALADTELAGRVEFVCTADEGPAAWAHGVRRRTWC